MSASTTEAERRPAAAPTGASDDEFMAVALGLARRGLGNVWPNPAVGCVIVADGRIVGRGWTQPGGRPHAETQALARAGDRARGATAYVTFEPCSHHGRTPPCADALVEAGIARVVIACGDPDPRVSGGGLARLRAAGVTVEEGLAQAAAQQVNAGFLGRIERGRPLVTLKMATSLDGRIATGSGDSKWITGAAARAFAHGLRLRHDATLAGIGTVLADDPELTCRLPGAPHAEGVRVVLDGNGRLPAESRLARTADSGPVWLVIGEEADAPERLPASVELIRCRRGHDGKLDPAAALTGLGERGLTRILVEGGGQVAGALLRAGLVDRIACFRAGLVLGGDGKPAIGDLGLERIGAAHRFRCARRWLLGDDLLEYWERDA